MRVRKQDFLRLFFKALRKYLTKFPQFDYYFTSVTSIIDEILADISHIIN